MGKEKEKKTETPLGCEAIHGERGELGKIEGVVQKLKIAMSSINQAGAQFSRSEERKVKRFDKKVHRMSRSYLRMIGKNPSLGSKTSLVILFNIGKGNSVHVTGSEHSISASLVSFLMSNKKFLDIARCAVDVAGTGHKPDAAEAKPGNGTESKPE